MDNTLTRMERPGIVRVPRELRQPALTTHLTTLKAQGHAIVVEEVLESNMLTGELMVYHYLTCTACKKGIL